MREKLAWGQAASSAAGQLGAQALIVTAVGTAVNDDSRVLRELGLNSINEVDPHEFERRVLKWCKLLTGETILARLPKRFRHDELMCIGMGPALAGASLRQRLDWVDGKPQWSGDVDIFDPRRHGQFEFNLIPAWWN